MNSREQEIFDLFGLKDGDIVDCYIESNFIKDAIFRIGDRSLFLEQDIADGSSLRNDHMEFYKYHYSWRFNIESVDEFVNFSDDVKIPITKTLYLLKKLTKGLEQALIVVNNQPEKTSFSLIDIANKKTSKVLQVNNIKNK